MKTLKEIIKIQESYGTVKATGKVGKIPQHSPGEIVFVGNKKLLKDLEKDDRTLNILCGIIVLLILIIITLIVYFCVFYKKEEDFQNYLNLNNSEVKYISSNEIRNIFDRFINQTYTPQKSIYNILSRGTIKIKN